LSTQEVSKTYNARRLRRLDRETVRFDRGAGSFFVAFAVFALDLSYFSHQHISSYYLDTISKLDASGFWEGECGERWETRGMIAGGSWRTGRVGLVKREGKDRPLLS
jgi:hypothetical protein